ncbi:SIMPL domain-containing protein [Bacillus sp. DNRA2]|uniref:SIMPL domain-containing protein n=1 Tax=Bacillus sp. DNRA2 TaxID=2723053 RepID=UPI00145C4DA1|nr:SIMPL domain-containing protein [Bacillus sp. DNRA2]NMD71016.1 SIMPL domain-containing protein [Bacillus sp. DNRA2]
MQDYNGFRPHQPSQLNNKSSYYQMTVRGHGEVMVKPDQAKLTIGIVTENQNVEAAQQENAATANRVISALKQLGIDDRSIKTNHYSIQPLYDYVGGKSVFRTYQVDHQLEVTVKDIARVGLVYQAAIKNGANRGGNIQFSVTNTDVYYRQALSKALQNARKKAEEIARTIGAVLNELPIKITEEQELSVRPIPFNTFKLSAAQAQETPPIQQGEYTIEAHVSVIYQYQNRYH